MQLQRAVVIRGGSTGHALVGLLGARARDGNGGSLGEDAVRFQQVVQA